VNDLAHVDAALHDELCLVRVRGEIDLSNASDVGDAVAAAVPGAAARVVVDLSGTTYLDSTGIAMIFHLSERLGHQRQPLRVVVPPTSVIRRVVDITDLGAVIPVDDGPPELA
jgi:anti-anti-sigma factor